MRGVAWCVRHQPGRAEDRRQRSQARQAADTVRLTTVARDVWVERAIAPGVLSWPPIARIVAYRPRHKRPVSIADAVSALVSLAAGDHEPWSLIVSRMRAAGLIEPGDKSLGEHVAHAGR